MNLDQPFIVGFQEWVGLPDLGLPALKAKLDTGARTSALHARMIEPFQRDGATWVRFEVQPVARRPAIALTCEARVVDQRAVTSSNGEAELRTVITTDIEIGAKRWPIELTLTNRANMRYRMLIGRQAMHPGILIDPTASFHQPRLSNKVYRALLKRP